MINVENLRKWIAALRSRRYKQCFGRLYRKTDNTYCALGVAGRELCKGEIYRDIGYKEIRKALGVNKTFLRDLTIQNDCGKKFYEIAKYLERKFKKELQQCN